jgi:hypothetical protein
MMTRDCAKSGLTEVREIREACEKRLIEMEREHEEEF